MHVTIQSFKKAAKNKVLLFILTGYASYIIQFINSILIAVYLGPYFFGIWGFIVLSIAYINQINFGISHSMNAIVSVNKQNKWYVTKIVGASFTMLIGLSISVALILILNNLLNFNIGEKYHFSQYVPFVFTIAVLGYFNGLYSNIFRIYGKLPEMIFSQSAYPILLLLTLLFYKGADLLWGLIIANTVALALAFLLFIANSPIKLRPNVIIRLIITIQNKGWHLFIYNTSFYLIIISTRSLISAFYNVAEFGLFTFAFTMASAVLLLLESLSYLIYPKMLNRFAKSSFTNITSILNQVRDSYITLSHALIHLSILFFPFFLTIFPKYSNSLDSFKYISLTIVLYTNSFGYSGLMIARNKEKVLGRISLIALCINITTALILIHFANLHYQFVILSTMFTYSLYVLALGIYGRNLLKLNTSFFEVINDVFPPRLMIPLISSLILVLLLAENIYFIIPLILFTTLNLKTLKIIFQIIGRIVLNPNLVNI